MKTDFEVFEKLSLNWAVVIVAVLVLMLLIRKITNGPKPKKHIKSHIVDNLYKSNLSIGKSNKKKRSKKQRTAESLKNESKKFDNLNRGSQSSISKLEKKKNKAKKKKPITVESISHKDLVDYDEGGEWHIVCSKEQRQAKKDKKQQRNEEETSNNESVEQNVASRSFNEYNSSFYATKDIPPRFARVGHEDWKARLKKNQPLTPTRPVTSSQPNLAKNSPTAVTIKPHVEERRYDDHISSQGIWNNIPSTNNCNSNYTSTINSHSPWNPLVFNPVNLSTWKPETSLLDWSNGNQYQPFLPSTPLLTAALENQNGLNWCSDGVDNWLRYSSKINHSWNHINSTIYPPSKQVEWSPCEPLTDPQSVQHQSVPIELDQPVAVWNLLDSTTPSSGDDGNSDWKAPEANWSNSDDWKVPIVPVKPTPTYFDDSADERYPPSMVSTNSGPVMTNKVVGAGPDLLTNAVAANSSNRKSRRRRRKKIVVEDQNPAQSVPTPNEEVKQTDDDEGEDEDHCEINL